MFWAFSDAMANKPTPWVNGTVLPDLEAATAYRAFAPDMYPRVKLIVDKIIASALIYLPSSVRDFANPKIDACLERYVRGSNGIGYKERIKVMKLLWDAVGTEFAGRHALYEANYAGNHEDHDGRAGRQTWVYRYGGEFGFGSARNAASLSQSSQPRHLRAAREPGSLRQYTARGRRLDCRRIRRADRADGCPTVLAGTMDDAGNRRTGAGFGRRQSRLPRDRVKARRFSQCVFLRRRRRASGRSRPRACLSRARVQACMTFTAL
jgi:hypothetical protein